MVSTDDKEIREFDREAGLKSLAVIEGSDVLRVDMTNSAPAKPREGHIRFADGTNWNPGGGKGIYAYYSGAWNKL